MLLYIHQVSCTRYLVPGTDRVQTDRQTDVVYMWSPVFVVSVSYEKNDMFFFLIRSIRNYTCLHEFKEVTGEGKRPHF